MSALPLIIMSAIAMPLALVMRSLIKLYKPCRVEEITPEWFETFSPALYYPMRGLLAREDFAFLSRQPGFDFSLHRKLRRDRLHIFRQYLTRLIIDFNRLHTAACVVLANSLEDRSEMASRLLVLKLRFTISVLKAEFNYVLCCIGFRTLEVQSLIARLEEMSAKLSSLSAAELA